MGLNITAPQLLRSPLFAEVGRFMEGEIKVIDFFVALTFEPLTGGQCFMVSKLCGLGQVT